MRQGRRAVCIGTRQTDWTERLRLSRFHSLFGSGITHRLRLAAEERNLWELPAPARSATSIVHQIFRQSSEALRKSIEMAWALRNYSGILVIWFLPFYAAGTVQNIVVTSAVSFQIGLPA